jgi:hypothetical protein
MLSWIGLGSVLSLATTVFAHGYVQQIVATSPAGTYTGSLPYQVCLPRYPARNNIIQSYRVIGPLYESLSPTYCPQDP